MTDYWLLITEEIEEEMDEETREFNFWTHQIHIFFLRKLFPAYEHMLEVQSGKERLRIEKEVSKQSVGMESDFFLIASLGWNTISN